MDKEGIEGKEEEEEVMLPLAFCCEDRENKNKSHQKEKSCAITLLILLPMHVVLSKRKSSTYG